ncbi:MAG: hypothetical protein QXF86_00690 [Candidatus Bilamarchaeaceae archaeon]
MFLVFDPYLLLLIIFCCFFVPGILISVALLKNSKVGFFEKIIIGLGLGFAVPQLIPFLSYFLLGIKYTHNMAIITVGLWWLIAIALAVWKRIDEDFSGLPHQITTTFQKDKRKLLIITSIIFIGILTFWIRLGSYSPVFQELDPYYYTYVAQQIIQLGHNPLNDQTAWWPTLEVSHRAIPGLAYMEALWYSLYNGSNDYNNMLLAVIASVYPPIAAMLAVFFFYIFLSKIIKPEYAVVGAAIASLAPIFIIKTMAGESEVQPYAFFALTFFYATYLIALKEKSKAIGFLSALTYIALAIGCASEILALTTLVIFWIFYGLLLFYKDENAEEIMKLLQVNAIILILGTILTAGIIKSSFYNGIISYSTTHIAIGVFILVILGALYFIQVKKRELGLAGENRVKVLFVTAFLLLILLLSPIGEPIKGLGRAGLSVVEYKTALERTIAEQGMAGHDFAGEMGFVGANYYAIANFLLSPLNNLITKPEGKELITNVGNGLGSLLSMIFILFSLISNIILSVVMGIINIYLNSNVVYEWKENSFLMFWTFFMIFFFAYVVYKKKEEKAEETMPILLLLLAVFFPFIVGIMKAKYTIYAAFFFGGGIAFVLANAEEILKQKKWIPEKNEWVLTFAILILIAQFFFNGLAYGLAINNFETRFQDNPLATKAKLDIICQKTNEPTVCAAAADPFRYASLGTNYQYDQKLCVLTALPDYTLLENPEKAKHIYYAVQLRCNRLSDYWISSMEWIRYNTEPNSRTISWWDYGHWINFFGQKNTVLRNEHSSLNMIYRVANAYTEGDENDLLQTMKDYGAGYALFDIEILASSSGFGAKYGALNYLGCVYVNRTNVSYWPGQSICEIENLWETIYVSPNKPCVISKTSNKTGYVASKVYILGQKGEMIYTPYYPNECIGEVKDEIKQFCNYGVKLEPVYCVGEVELANGQKTTGTYYLNKTYPNGDLKLNKALLTFPFTIEKAYGYGTLFGFTTIYTKDKIWLENGTIVDGYEDRKGHFYDSNIYKALVLNKIEGFEKVYDNGAVKIYKPKSE